MLRNHRRKADSRRNRSFNNSKHRQRASLGLEQLEPRLVLATSVLSYHMDAQSSGVNSTETLLTTGNVNTSTFGKTFSTPLDGQAYAEPLYVPGVNITTGNFPGIHNTVFAATEHDGLYAIDAQGGNVLWYDSFLNPAISGVALAGATTITSVPNSDVNSSDINPEIGITGTPTIDASQNAIFVITKTKQIVPVGGTNHTHYVAELFKINIQNGAVIASHIIGDTDDTSGYVYRTQISASATNQDPFVFGNGDGAITVNGQSRVYFNALRQMSRPGMTLFGGQIYTSWASHGDNGPYHGWVLKFDENTLALTGVLNTTPNGGLGGIWQGGDITTIDPHLDASGNPIFYFETGNGTFDGNYNTTTNQTTGLNAQGFPANGDYSDSFVKIGIDTTSTQASQNINGWGFKVLDYFSPSNNQSLNAGDTDLGSGGTTILPDSVGNAAHPHLLIGSGKEGKIYLIDRDNMGKFDPNNVVTDHVVEEQKELSGVLNAAAYFNNTIYYVPGYGGSAATFSIANGSAAYSVSATHTTTDTFGNLSGSPTISANGTTNAIMWALNANGDNTLRAYNASTLAELWTSNQATGNRDALVGSVLKFTVPTVADGQVFVGTSTSLVAYGPPVTPTSGPAAPSNAAATALTFKSVSVTWQDNSNNEDFFSIQRSTSAGGPFVEIGEASANSTSFADSNNLLSQTTYYYQVEAHNIFQGGTFSAPSNVVSVTTPQAPPTGTGDGLEGAYYVDSGGNHLTGTPTLTRVDPEINFANSNASPGPGIGATGFSVKWTGRIQAQFTQTYTFFTESDDGVRLFIKPTTSNAFTTVVNNFTDHGPTENSGTFAMSGGQVYDVEMDFYQNGGGWEAELLWSSTSTPKDFVPQSQLYSGAAPVAPSGLTAVAASGTTINVNWIDNSNNETGFTVERTNPDNSVSDFSVAPNTTAYLDTGLTPGATYGYRVQATNFVANSAFTPKVQVTMPVAPPTPSNGHVTAVSTTSISIAWQLNSTNSTNKETGVSVFRKLGSSGTFILIATLPAGSTSYTDHGTNGNGLAIGQYYDYHVQAFNLAGATDFTGATVDTLTAAPSGLAATPGVGLISLSWTAPPVIPENGITYNIYRGTVAGAENLTPIASQLTSPSYADVTATPGQPYFYVVKAVDTGGPSAPSNEVNSTATSSSVPAPASLTATIAGTQINLSWSSVGVATSYNFYRATSPGGEGITPIASVLTGTTFSDPNRLAGLSYYYQVTSVNGSGESARSVEAVGVLAPAAPTNVAAALDGNNTNDIDVTWTAPAGVMSYNVFRGSTPGGEGSTPFATGVTGTVFVDSGAATSPGISYYYTVVAINAGGQSPASAEAFFATPPVAPTTPTAAIKPSGNVALAWSTVTGAVSFNVYRATSPGGEGTTPLVTGLGSPSYVDSFVGNGGTFYYEVTALGLGGESVKSGEASVSFIAAAPKGPTNLSATSTSNSQINLSWTASTGATGYNIFRGTSVGGEGPTPINASPLTATSFSDTGLAQLTHYYYTVRAINGSGAGPASNETTAVTQQLFPTATVTPLIPNTVTNGPAQLQIVFNEAVSGFTISSLSFSRSGGPNLLTASQTLTTSDNTTYTLGNLSSLDVLGGTYTLTFTAAGSNVVDSFGTSAVANASGSFVVSPVAPEVSAVYVSGSAWQQSFLNFLASNGLGDAQLGYRLMGGPNQLGSLPWTNVNVISVVFSRDVNINTASLALAGSPDLGPAPALGTASFTYNSATFTAQWVYRAALPLDKYLLSIPSAAVTSKASGAALDGEFVNGSGNLLPSGDTVAGGDFNFRFNILPGDVDQNGVVTGLDGGDVRQHFQQFTTTLGYIPLYDTSGKGEITGIDLDAVQATLLHSLPATDPTPPGQGGGGALASAADSSAAPAASAAPSIAAPPAAPAATPAAVSTTATTATTKAAATMTSTAIVTSVSPSLASAPVTPPAKALARDLVLETLPGSTSGGSAERLLAALSSSVTSLNSLALSGNASHHGGWMLAHDAIFAELDSAGLISTTSNRTSKTKRGG
jgi:fibronectin type 3 domain-containing protein